MVQSLRSLLNGSIFLIYYVKENGKSDKRYGGDKVGEGEAVVRVCKADRRAVSQWDDDGEAVGMNRGGEAASRTEVRFTSHSPKFIHTIKRIL